MRKAARHRARALVIVDEDKPDRVKNIFRPDVYEEDEMPQDYNRDVFGAAAGNLAVAYEDTSDVSYTNIENAVSTMCEFLEKYVEFLDAEAGYMYHTCVEHAVFPYLQYVIMYIESPLAIELSLYVLVTLFWFFSAMVRDGNGNSDEWDAMANEICTEEFVEKLITISINPETCVPEAIRSAIPEATLQMCMSDVWHLPKHQYDIIQVRSLQLLCELAAMSYDTRTMLIRGALNDIMCNLMIPVKTHDQVSSVTGEEVTIVATSPIPSNDLISVLITLIMTVLENTDEIWAADLSPYAHFFLDHIGIDDKIDILCTTGVTICCDKDINLVDMIIDHPKMAAIAGFVDGRNIKKAKKAMKFTDLLMCNASQEARGEFASMVNWEQWGANGWACGAGGEREELACRFIEMSGRILDHNWENIYQLFVDNKIMEVMLFCAKDGCFRVRKKAALVLVSLLDRLGHDVVINLLEGGLIEFLSHCADQLKDYWLIQVFDALIYLMSGVLTPDMVIVLFQEMEESGLDEILDSIMDSDNDELFAKTQQYMETREQVEEMLRTLQPV